MKTTTIAAVVLCCAASAIAPRSFGQPQAPAKGEDPRQSRDEKPVNESMMYTYRVTTKPENSSTRNFEPAYQPIYKNVKPPVPELDVARKTYPVDNQSGSVIVHPSGTTLYVPQGAFADASGKEIKGNVTVAYREFKNPVDFVFGGIPMSYDAEGSKNMFLSAGMFELTASANGAPVYLKEDKKVDVQMTSMDKRPDYNLYAFNDSTGAWEERESKSNIPVSETVLPTYSPAVIAYFRFMAYNQRRRAVDTTTCRTRFTSNDYFYTSQSSGPLSYRKNRWWSKGHSYSALVKVKDVRRNRKDGSVVFRLERTVSNTHTELGIYSRTAWKVDENSHPDLKNALSNKNGFFDVRIEKTGGTYSIVLKGVNGFVTVNAEPVRMSHKKKVSEYSNAMKNYLYKNYCRILRGREKTFDKQIAKDLKRYRKTDSKAKRELRAWKGAKTMMSAGEKQMPLEQWKVYAEAEKENQRKISDAVASTSSNIIRSFAIDGMGIWNCDQIRRLDDPVKVVAKYSKKDGSKIQAASTYVVDKKLNGVLQYYDEHIAYSPKSDNVFIVIRPDGGVAYTTSAELNERPAPERKKNQFPLNEASASSTVEELRKLIGM